MIPLSDLLTKLLDTRTKFTKIQSSDDKSVPSVYALLDDALTYDFLRFGNAYFIPAISIDIDKHKDVGLTLAIIKDAGLPIPNFSVYTNKGFHLHWVLDKPISTMQKPSLFLYQHIADALIDLLGSDPHGMPRRSGRMFRNPLTHATQYYTDTMYTLQDFKCILPDQKTSAHHSKESHIVNSKRSRGYIPPDFTKVQTGSRNNILFDYGRHLAYRYGNKDGLSLYLLNALTKQNVLLPRPLDKAEVMDIASSISTFMERRYTSKGAGKKTTEFNRRLAKKAERLKKAELVAKWAALGVLTLKRLKGMSLREGGRVLNVSPQTFKKHKEHLLSIIKELPSNALKALSKLLVPIEKVISFSALVGSKTDILKVNRCNSPPHKTHKE